MIDICRVGAGSLELVWPQLLPMVERGLARAQGDSVTSEQMKAAIARGDMELWAVTDGTPGLLAGIVLSIEKYPNKQTLHVHMAAGRDIARWIDDIEQLLAEYRTLTSCNTIEAVCRPGMARFLARRRWKEKAIIMELKT